MVFNRDEKREQKMRNEEREQNQMMPIWTATYAQYPHLNHVLLAEPVEVPTVVTGKGFHVLSIPTVGITIYSIVS